MQTLLVAAFCAVARVVLVEAASVLTSEREVRVLLQVDAARLRGAGHESPGDFADSSLQSKEDMRQRFLALVQRGSQAVEDAWNRKVSPRERAMQSNKETAAITLLVVFTVLVWIALTGASAHLYIRQKRWPEPAPGADPEQADLDFRQFSSGIFDCSQDGRSCCWAMLCPCIRWADNMGMVGILGYWVGITLFCSIMIMNMFSGGVVLWLVASAVWMSYRQQLRKKFCMDHGSAKTYLTDCLLYCFCCQCTIAQEARHIEAAGRAGHWAVSEPKDYDDPMEILGTSDEKGGVIGT